MSIEPNFLLQCPVEGCDFSIDFITEPKDIMFNCPKCGKTISSLRGISPYRLRCVETMEENAVAIRAAP